MPPRKRRRIADDCLLRQHSVDMVKDLFQWPRLVWQSLEDTPDGHNRIARLRRHLQRGLVTSSMCSGKGTGETVSCYLEAVAESRGVQNMTGHVAAQAWDASETSAAAVIGAAVGSSVLVQRGGDGHATSIFTVTYLRSGDHPLLSVNGSTLARSPDGEVTVSVEEVSPGGISFTPVPGRYLPAASPNASVQGSL